MWKRTLRPIENSRDFIFIARVRNERRNPLVTSQVLALPRSTGAHD